MIIFRFWEGVSKQYFLLKIFRSILLSLFPPRSPISKALLCPATMGKFFQNISTQGLTVKPLFVVFWQQTNANAIFLIFVKHITYFEFEGPNFGSFRSSVCLYWGRRCFSRPLPIMTKSLYTRQENKHIWGIVWGKFVLLGKFSSFLGGKNWRERKISNSFYLAGEVVRSLDVTSELFDLSENRGR